MRGASFAIAALAGFMLFDGCNDGSAHSPDAALRGCARCKTNEVCVESITDCCGCDPDPTTCVASGVSCAPDQCTHECEVALCGDRYPGDGGVFPSCNYPGGCQRTVTEAFPCYAPYLGS